MRRVTCVAISGVVLAAVVWAIVGHSRANDLSNEPLRVTVLPVEGDHYVVRVKNVSSRTVRGFSLGYICHCQTNDSEGNPYPPGTAFTSLFPDRQLLHAGEVQELSLPAYKGLPPMVWVDVVQFDDGTNWGQNFSHHAASASGSRR
jgi:hypothetical protein